MTGRWAFPWTRQVAIPCLGSLTSRSLTSSHRAHKISRRRSREVTDESPPWTPPIVTLLRCAAIRPSAPRRTRGLHPADTSPSRVAETTACPRASNPPIPFVGDQKPAMVCATSYVWTAELFCPRIPPVVSLNAREGVPPPALVSLLPPPSRISYAGTEEGS